MSKIIRMLNNLFRKKETKYYYEVEMCVGKIQFPHTLSPIKVEHDTDLLKIPLIGMEDEA